MPGRDTMGPLGQGPRSGRRRGQCGGAAARADRSAGGPGLGQGRRGVGAGGAGGWRHRHRAAGGAADPTVGAAGRGRFAGRTSERTREQELVTLRHQAARLEWILGHLSARIRAMASPGAEAAAPEAAAPEAAAPEAPGTSP